MRMGLRHPSPPSPIRPRPISTPCPRPSVSASGRLPPLVVQDAVCCASGVVGARVLSVPLSTAVSLVVLVALLVAPVPVVAFAPGPVYVDRCAREVGQSAHLFFFLLKAPPPKSPLFPCTPLSR